jgi:hypothetical protein
MNRIIRQGLIAGFLILQGFCVSLAGAAEWAKPLTTKVLITGPKGRSKATYAGMQLSTVLAGAKKKEVMLMRVSLPAAARHALLSQKGSKDFSVKSMSIEGDSLPGAADIGMNGVPVLDQGMHGACVTFAATAAVDAVFGQGDYVSQLCQLGLGRYLEQIEYSYMPSGWDGSTVPWVMDQMMRFGVVSKATQNEATCGGVKEYPLLNTLDNGRPVSPQEFGQHSEPLIGRVYYAQLMSYEQRIAARFSNDDHARTVLNHVKQSIVTGNRVLFGTFLVLSPYCSAGACATHHQTQDTWALTRELNTPPFEMGGHEMVIIGYNDLAEAVDSEGKTHRGLLTLRNSWGEEVGDKGNFYMTYDYFVKFASDAHEVGAVSLFF